MEGLCFMRNFIPMMLALLALPCFAAPLPPAAVSPTTAIPRTALSNDQNVLNNDATLPTDAQARDVIKDTNTPDTSPAALLKAKVRADHERLDKANYELNNIITNSENRLKLRAAVNDAKHQLELDQKACTAAAKAANVADAQAVIDCL